MRIARVRGPAGPELVILTDGGAVHLDGLDLGASGDVVAPKVVMDRVRKALSVGRVTRSGDLQLMAPVMRPGKIICIGLNYADHAGEVQMNLPSGPLITAKFSSAIIGPNETIVWDREMTGAVDYEAELAVVIGATADHVNVRDALNYVLGYTCLNDVTARDIQFAEGQWVRAKSLSTFCPIGPWIVTADEIKDPQDLSISCSINGDVVQDSTTGHMIFSVAELISRLSHSMILEAGDVIATGTPAGAGYFRDPRRLLRDRDTVTVSIAGIGDLVNPCRTVPEGRASRPPADGVMRDGAV